MILPYAVCRMPCAVCRIGVYWSLLMCVEPADELKHFASNQAGLISNCQDGQ